MKRIIFTLVFLAFSITCFAQEKEILSDRIIGSTFKILAKSFVATSNINQLKTDNISKLNRMEDDKFRKRYAQIYEVIKELPDQLKATYGIREEMTKEQAIKDINLLDKKKANELIDSIPDNIIAEQFRQYLRREEAASSGRNMAEQINSFWNKITRKISASGMPAVNPQIK